MKFEIYIFPSANLAIILSRLLLVISVGVTAWAQEILTIGLLFGRIHLDWIPVLRLEDVGNRVEQKGKV